MENTKTPRDWSQTKRITIAVLAIFLVGWFVVNIVVSGMEVTEATVDPLTALHDEEQTIENEIKVIKPEIEALELKLSTSRTRRDEIVEERNAIINQEVFQ